VNEEVLKWFIKRFEDHIDIALTVVLEENHNLQHNKSFIAIARWFQNNRV
jgi:hypothetical protein